MKPKELRTLFSPCCVSFIACLVSTLICIVSLAAQSLPLSAQTYGVIYKFAGGAEAYPTYVPTQGRDGRIYGATGGASPALGAVFSMTIKGAFTELFAFQGTTGSAPNAGVTLGSDGSFYGTTSGGGASGDGVLFSITRDGKYTDLHDFSGDLDGKTPGPQPIAGADGAFYGTTYGDTKTSSTVYEYSSKAGFSTIFVLDQAVGAQVFTPLIQATDGTLYGTAYLGGASNCGSLFQISTGGKLLWSYSFSCGATGVNPAGPLMQASDGNFYGTTYLGGVNGVSTIFKVDQKHIVTVVHNFAFGASDGRFPFAGLAQGSDGKLYGTTQAGGTADSGGVIYQMSLDGSYQVLYSFLQSSGWQPDAAPMQYTNGLLYGTTADGSQSEAFGGVYSFDMGLAPFCTFVRSLGRVGSTVQILGQGFKGATAVSFNGVRATNFMVRSDTYMTAIVPVGATTGPVVVTTAAGTLPSNKNYTVQGTIGTVTRAASRASRKD